MGVRFGFGREPEEPEILDSGPPERETPSGGRTAWLRMLSAWLSGRETVGRGRGAGRLRRVPGWAVAGAAVLLAAGGLVLATEHGRQQVPSATPIVWTASLPPVCRGFVITSSSAFPGGDRVAFGDVGLPAAFQATLPPRMEATGTPGWQYAVRAGFTTPGHGPPVTIEVPANWRKSVQLRNAHSMSSTLHLPSCPSQATWNTYVSVFYLHSPTACVPLRITAGRHAGTFWFGLGQHCAQA